MPRNHPYLFSKMISSESSSSSRIYVGEFVQFVYGLKRRTEIAFEILSHDDPVSEKYPILNECEYPIRIHHMNGLPIKDGYAVALTSEWHYIGTILAKIVWDDVSYIAGDECLQYWFPSGNRPNELADGSMRVDLEKTSNLGTVFLCPLNTLPFMDICGKFIYEYNMVAKEDTKYKFNTPVTLFQKGNVFGTLLDNTTSLKHIIRRVVTFREMLTSSHMDNPKYD